MKKESKGGYFKAHGTARAESLAGVPLASFAQRAAAFLIDFFVVLVTYVPIEFAVRLIIQTLRHRHERIDIDFDFHHPGNVIWLVLYFGLIVWRTGGQTPGKHLLGIRVVSLVHPRITLWQAIERSLGYGASILEGGFGFIQYFIHPNHCCVHDRIAETIVVRDPRKPRPPSKN